MAQYKMVSSSVQYIVEDHDCGKPDEDYQRYVTVQRSYIAHLEYTRADGSTNRTQSISTMHLNVFQMRDGSIDVWKELWQGDVGYDSTVGTKRPSRKIQDEAAEWVRAWLADNLIAA